MNNYQINKDISKNQLFKIGQMAEMFDVNIQTLRYYDHVGILKPEYIDITNNYRYYSTKQFERLNTIKYLRSLNVSIEDISSFFNGKDVTKLVGILKKQRTLVNHLKKQIENNEKKINSRIFQIEAALSSALGEISIRQFKPRKMLKIERKFSFNEDLEPIIRQLCKKYKTDDIIFLGKVGISINHSKLLLGDISQYSSLFVILDETEELLDYSLEILEEGLYVTINYKGTHAVSEEYYRKCLDFIEEKGFEIIGDSLEITLVDAGITNDPEQFITEIQIPIK